MKRDQGDRRRKGSVSVGDGDINHEFPLAGAYIGSIVPDLSDIVERIEALERQVERIVAALKARAILK